MWSNNSTSFITVGKAESFPSIKSKPTVISSLIFLIYTPPTLTTAWNTSLPSWNNKCYALTKVSLMTWLKNLDIFNPLLPTTTILHPSSPLPNKPSKYVTYVPPRSGKWILKSSRINWRMTLFCEWVYLKRYTQTCKTKMVNFSPETKIKYFLSSSM